MSTKLTVDFDGFDEMIAKLESLGNPKITVERALKESHTLITKELEKVMESHNRTHQTERSIKRSADVEWEGNIAFSEVGFDIANGGIASIFLMYGTPKMSPDKKLYNAIYGTAMRKKIREIQEEAFNEEIRRVMS